MMKLLKIFLGFIGIVGMLFLLMFILTNGDYHVPETVSDDPSIPHITIDGITFHTQTFGNPQNPVVIVVHGGPGWDYKSLLPLQALSDEFYVVFYDQRGSGLSPRVEADTLTLQSYLEDLDAIISYYAGDKKVDLIGHSWGAMLVSGYIGKHPERVNHVVLAEPGFLTTKLAKEAGITFGPKLDLNFILYAAKTWFQSLHIKTPDEQASSDYLLGQVAPKANPEYYCNGVVPEAGMERWRASAVSMQNIMQLVLNSDGEIDVNLIEGVDKFTNKILFIATQCNAKIGANYQKKQMAFFQNTELAIIENSGHMMFRENPVDSINTVRAYLSN